MYILESDVHLLAGALSELPSTDTGARHHDYIADGRVRRQRDCDFRRVIGHVAGVTARLSRSARYINPCNAPARGTGGTCRACGTCGTCRTCATCRTAGARRTCCTCCTGVPVAPVAPSRSQPCSARAGALAMKTEGSCAGPHTVNPFMSEFLFATRVDGYGDATLCYRCRHPQT